ncbi:MAG TPA: hypothetical protein VG013_18815 [Gemmataceae bacterium]|nr:hypothetical protein [Gemmataceae bacterium]
MPSNQATESEWQTRKRCIDRRLEALGWTLVAFDPLQPLSSFPQHAITEYQTDNGPADYALSLGGTLLGIGEAKNDPVLLPAGGWRPADRAFEGKLNELLSEYNQALAV